MPDVDGRLDAAITLPTDQATAAARLIARQPDAELLAAMLGVEL